jgi:multiple sugar transport system substrate-binding protein
MWQCFLWQAGGDVLDVNRRIPTWNSPAGVEALQFWVDLVHKHRVAALEAPADVDLKGRAGVWIMPIGSLSIVQRAVGNAFEWASAALVKGKQRASNVGGHALMVMRTNRHHEQAWRFVHWFTAAENVVEFNVPSITLPPWKSAQQQPAWQRYVRAEPRVQPFVEMLGYGHPPPKVVSWPDAEKVLGQAIEAAITLAQQPRAALDEAARVAEPLLKQG